MEGGKWRVRKDGNGPMLLMDADERVVGFRDKRGADWHVPMVQATAAETAALADPIAGTPGGGSYIGSGNEAEMLAVTGATVGQYFLRTDVIPKTNYYLDALPSSTLSNWRSALPIDPNAPIMTVMVIGDSIMEGYSQVGGITAIDRTSNVITVASSNAPVGGNYIGQKVRLMGIRPNGYPDDVAGVYTKVTTGSPGANDYTVASLGQNISNANLVGTPARYHRILAAEPSTSPYWWAKHLASGRAKCLGNFCIPGARIQTIADRVDLDVAPRNPARVVLMAGTNNISDNTAGTASDDAVAAFAAMPALVARLVALGVQVDLCAVIPTGLGSVAHAAFNARVPLFNALLADLAAQYPDNVKYRDTYTPLVSDIGSGEMGAAASLVLADGVHPRARGAFIAGRVIYNGWVADGVLGRVWTPEPLFGTVPLDLSFRTSSGDAIAGTGGSGTEGPYCTITRATGTPTFVGSLVQRADGKYAQRIVITPSASTFSSLSVKFDASFHLYAPQGSSWRFVVDLKTIDAPECFSQWSFIVGVTVNGVANSIYPAIDSTGNTLPADADSEFRYTSTEFQIPNPGAGSVTAFTVDVQPSMIGGDDPPNNVCTVEISNFKLIRVA